MKKLIILTGLLLSTSAYAQTEVTAGVTRGKDYGVTYAPVSYTHLTLPTIA